jgi:hypothetical protein
LIGPKGGFINHLHLFGGVENEKTKVLKSTRPLTVELQFFVEKRLTYAFCKQQAPAEVGACLSSKI